MRTKAWAPTALGEALVAIRKQVGLTQETLAAKSRIARTVIARIESGQSQEPDLRTVQALARALGVSASALLGEEEAVDTVDLVRRYEASDEGRRLPLREEERAWLLSRSPMLWTGLPPTPATVAVLVRALRTGDIPLE